MKANSLFWHPVTEPFDRKRPVVAPKPYDNTSAADMNILTSILRREGFQEGIFNYRGHPTTIEPKTINGIKVKQ